MILFDSPFMIRTICLCTKLVILLLFAFLKASRSVKLACIFTNYVDYVQMPQVAWKL